MVENAFDSSRASEKHVLDIEQSMLSNTLHDSLIATNFPHVSTLLDLEGFFFFLKGQRK